MTKIFQNTIQSDSKIRQKKQKLNFKKKRKAKFRWKKKNINELRKNFVEKKKFGKRHKIRQFIRMILQINAPKRTQMCQIHENKSR